MELHSLLGETTAIRALNEEITYASRCDAKVLVTGESGVGKEVVARLIHANSARRRAQLITVNCAALTDTLLETELFGHVRGSFTGAYRDRQGALELAHRGTVFMDEVGETSPRMQGLLLRFLEAGEIQRVGSDAIQSRVDVRVIAATNRQLVDSVAAKTFREDLYYRLNVIHIRVPSLRERREDIPTFVEFFLDQFSRQYSVSKPILTPATSALLSEYKWPGNVRELKNIIERLVVRASDIPIEPRDLPLEVLRGTSAEQQQQAAAAGAVVTTAPARSAADALFERMVNGGESFWSAVYAPFMSRDLTRDDVRAIVRRGLERTGGNYRVMVELFNMPIDDYKRFLGVLRKYQCHMPFQQFRSAAGTRTTREQAGEATQPIA